MNPGLWVRSPGPCWVVPPGCTASGEGPICTQPWKGAVCPSHQPGDDGSCCPNSSLALAWGLAQIRAQVFAESVCLPPPPASGGAGKGGGARSLVSGGKSWKARPFLATSSDFFFSLKKKSKTGFWFGSLKPRVVVGLWLRQGCGGALL